MAHVSPLLHLVGIQALWFPPCCLALRTAQFRIQTKEMHDSWGCLSSKNRNPLSVHVLFVEKRICLNSKFAEIQTEQDFCRDGLAYTVTDHLQRHCRTETCPVVCNVNNCCMLQAMLVAADAEEAWYIMKLTKSIGKFVASSHCLRAWPSDRFNTSDRCAELCLRFCCLLNFILL